MMEASLYDKIMDQQRLEPEFFRVGFYGKKFPFFLRVKNPLIKERINLRNPPGAVARCHHQMSAHSNALPSSSSAEQGVRVPRP